MKKVIVQTLANQVVVSPTTNVIEVRSPGIQGPPGPASEQITRTAASNVGGHRIVVSDASGQVSHASNTNAAHLQKVLGISLNAASAGDPVSVLRAGAATMVGWNWNVSLPLYLAEDGLITQTPPSSGFSLIVGFAETPTSVIVRFREPIILS